MCRAACASILFVGVATAVAAQDKPDFSGQWELVATEPSSAGAASRLTVWQPITRANVFGAPMKPAFLELSVERTFADRTTTDTHQIGIQGGMVGGGGFQTRFSVRWEDNRLVMATASYFGSGAQSSMTSERNEVWELNPDGMLIITVTDTDTGREPKSTTLTYHRK
jgi:hypothetical protein